MKPAKSVLVLTTILIASLLWIPLSFAAPNEMNFQGRLTDASGNPVADGSYSMEFWLSDALGTSLWGETQDVLVINGIYNVTLGQGTPISGFGPLEPDLFGEDDRWMQVFVNGEELTPRQKITSVAYAFQAGSTTAGAVTSVMLADDAVTETKVADSSITAAKIVGGSDSGLDSDTLDGHDTTYFATGEQLSVIQATLTSLQNQITNLQNENQELQDLLQYVSVIGNQIYINGANLHIRNGSGATDGVRNGLGNLIIGYNEERDYYSCSLGESFTDATACMGAGGLWWQNFRDGSHNLVVGARHNFSRFGGIVAGNDNTISGDFASVSGGSHNTASGRQASVSGGLQNSANGINSSTSGGYNNNAIGEKSTISGGTRNSTIQLYSSISGGYDNIASGWGASVGGGNENQATGIGSSVSGGSHNKASGSQSSMGGGYGNESFGSQSSVSGGNKNYAEGQQSSILGGMYNRAIGFRSSISGGGGANPTEGNVTTGTYSSILGGMANIAGDDSCIVESNGVINCSGEFDSDPEPDLSIGANTTVSGGRKNFASDFVATVGGGEGNFALNRGAVVMGGDANFASGYHSTIVGGSGGTILLTNGTMSQRLSVEVLEIRGP